MAAPTKCPKCRNSWGLGKIVDAKPQDGTVPAQPARWKCESCYARFDEAAD